MEPDETKLLDRLAAVPPEQQSGNQSSIHRNTRDTVSHVVYRLYMETLRKTLIRAVTKGYAGVDVLHLEIEGLSPHSKLDIWQARKWKKEPPELPSNQGRRYDFRYYDRERLITSLEPTTSRRYVDGCSDTANWNDGI